MPVVRVAVAVLGDGPAGAAVALALLARGIEVAVLGGGRAGRIGEHLAPSAWRSIEALALTRCIDTGPHRSSPGVASTWGNEEEERRDYLFQPWLRGLNLDRTAFDRQLMAEVVRRGGQLLKIPSAQALTRTDRGWRLSDARGSAVESCFLVDATGRRAWVARRLGGRIRSTDRLVAVWARYRPTSSPPDASLRLKAVPTGWCYAAPLADGTVAAAYLTDADLLSRCFRIKPHWVERLRTMLASILPLDGDVDGNVHVVPARSQLTAPAAGRAWMAVGDAATALDPLSSAGIPKAMADGVEAADAIAPALAGDLTKLERWNMAIRRRFSTFLNDQRTYYGLERRWPDEIFWRRRTAPSSPSTASRVRWVDAATHTAMLRPRAS
jgi:flavin-dependent dehydrogenase